MAGYTLDASWLAGGPHLSDFFSDIFGQPDYDPAGLAVSMAGADATLTWYASPSAEGVTSYDLYRRTPPTGALFVPGSDTPVATSVTSPYVDASLAAATYEWQVYGNYSSGIADSFNRADSSTALGTADTGQTWSALNLTWGITSNKAYCVTGTDNGIAAIDAANGNDMLVQADVASASASGFYPGIIARVQDASNFYMAHMRDPNDAGGGYDLFKCVSGSYTSLGSTSGTGTSSATLGLRVASDNLTVYANGTPVITTTGGSAVTTGTSGGLRCGTFGGSPVWDNFSIA